MPGSDATTLAPDGPLRGSVFHGAYTWAAWFYRFTVQQERLFEPAEAVRPYRPAGGTARACRSRRAPGRRGGGRCRVRRHDAVRAGTTYEPNRLATGVSHVVVNGVVTLRDGELTGDRAGEVLRRS